MIRLYILNGRGERIRTSDHLHPMQVRYQAALRPEQEIIANNAPILETITEKHIF